MQDSTVPEKAASVSANTPVEPVIGLVAIWCPNEPHRIGAWLPVREGTWIWGRGGALAGDGHPRLPIFRQRPGVNLTVTPFESASLSRVQLIARRLDEVTLDLDNIGQCGLRVNGREVKQSRVVPNDVIELGSQVAFLCAIRPARLEGEPAKAHAFGDPDEHGFVGESPAAWRLRSEISFAGPQPLHVLICGASGTGKELVARALHALSGRKGAFVARNAATLPEALVDAELFGNPEGYPNPGMRERKGLIGAADKGTLFLDEIAELPEAEQTHFLRVLDAGEYQRLGEATMRRADLRLVAATNRPISTLRGDMAARFGFTISLPDLSARREDVPLLVRHLLRSIGKESPALVERFFQAGDEPRISKTLIRELVANPPEANVRGLRSILWRALADSSGSVIEPPSSTEEPTGAKNGSAASSAEERTRIEMALNENAGSVEKTWRTLGLGSRFALMRLMKKHGIEIAKRATKRA